MNHSKSDMLKAVEAKLPEGAIRKTLLPFAPTLVLVDLLQFLNVVHYYHHARHGNVDTETVTMGDIVWQVQNYLSSQCHRTYETTQSVRKVVCTIDYDADVPVAKGPTQRSRKQNGVYVDPCERDLAINRGTKAMESFRKNQEKKAYKLARFEEYRRSPSIFDLEDRIGLAIELGIVPNDHDRKIPLDQDQTIALLLKICEFELPIMFLDDLVSGSKGYRQYFIQFIVQSMLFLEQYYPAIKEGQEIEIHGHYCTKDLLGIDEMTWDNGELVTDEELLRMPLKLESGGKFDPVFTLCYLGEADYQMMYAIASEQINDPSTRLVVQCITNDTDAVWHSLWLLNKFTYGTSFGSSMRPQIYITTKKKVNDRTIEIHLDVNEMFEEILKLIPPTSTYERNPPSMVEMYSFLTMVASFSGDYTVGYSYITAQTMLDAYLEYRFWRIGMLVKIEPNDIVTVDNEAYNYLVLSCYYWKYAAKLNLDGTKERTVANLKDLQPEHAIAKLQDCVGAEYKAVFNMKLHLAKQNNALIDPRPLVDRIKEMNIDQFNRFLSATNKRMPPLEQIFYRLQLLSYYLFMMSSIGEANLWVPDPLKFGYRIIDPTQPLSRHNIKYAVDEDYDQITRIRHELITDGEIK